jgi:hypothetical protein
MATLIGPRWIPAPRRPRGSALGLVLSLVFLVTGGSMLLAGLLLRSSRVLERTVPPAAVDRAPTVRVDGIRVVPQVTDNSRLRLTTTTRTNTKTRPERRIGHDQNRVDRRGIGIVRSDLQQQARRLCGCAGACPASVQLAATPPCQDLRTALTMMAKAQYRGQDRTAISVDAWTTSDDRIANALFDSVPDSAPPVDNIEICANTPVSHSPQPSPPGNSAGASGRVLDSRVHRCNLIGILTVVDCSCNSCYALGPAMRHRMTPPSRSPPPHQTPQRSRAG